MHDRFRRRLFKHSAGVSLFIQTPFCKIQLLYFLVFNISAGLQTFPNHFFPVSVRQLTRLPVIQFHDTIFSFGTTTSTGYPIHILSTDCTDFLQHIYHSINGCCSDLVVFFQRFIIYFFTAGSFIFQNDVQKHFPLSGDPASLFFQFLKNNIFLHFRPMISAIHCHLYSPIWLLPFPSN